MNSADRKREQNLQLLREELESRKSNPLFENFSSNDEKEVKEAEHIVKVLHGKKNLPSDLKARKIEAKKVLAAAERERTKTARLDRQQGVPGWLKRFHEAKLPAKKKFWPTKLR